MGAVKKFLEAVTLEVFGVINDETLEKAKVIAQGRLTATFRGCANCTLDNCWDCERGDGKIVRS